MKTTTVLRLGLLALVIALGLLVVPGVTKPVWAASPEIIDNFNISQTVQQAGTGSSFGVITDTVDGNIINRQREITVTVTATGSDNHLKAEANSGGLGRLAHAQGTGVQGRTTIVWDGTADGGAPGVDRSGLNFMLTNDGNSAFVLMVRFSDAPGTVRVTFFERGTANCSSLSRNLPSARVDNTTQPKYLVFPYSQFSAGSTWGCSTAANASNVTGAVVVEIIGETSGTAGWDTEIDFVELARIDYGDLPSDYAITTLANNGAGHVYNSSLYLGSIWDWESDGQESNNAVNDDNNVSSGSSGDDEDSVVVYGDSWASGQAVSVTVAVNGNGCLYAWIDWNKSLDFSNTNERVISDTVTTGTYTYNITVPNRGQSSPFVYYSRFRLSERTQEDVCPERLGADRGIDPWLGNEYGGEVEDHLVGRSPTAVGLSSLKAESADVPLLPLAVVALVGVGALGAVMLARRRRRQ